MPGKHHVRYGWKRSPEDIRDKVANPEGLTILPDVDLRKSHMPAVFDQGQLGSCTANAVAACLQFDLSQDIYPRRARRRSRLDIYYGERMIEGSPASEDSGAFGRDGFKFAQNTGVILEVRWPYDISTFAGPPPSNHYKRYKLTKPYAAVQQDEDHIKAILSNNQLIAFGFDVYESFESYETEQTGIVTYPDVNQEQYLGGHEVVACGYLSSKPGYFLVRNSWGTSWGESGYCWFPSKYLCDPSLCSDLRTIVRATA